MFNLETIKRVYFIGIGGIGMSAIARYFNQKGLTVSGYDKTSTVLTLKMEQEGMIINYTDDVRSVDKTVQLVVYTPAIPTDHQQYNYYKNNNYTLLKRSDVLGMITQRGYSICVAGTHGKTTISTMIAHILQESNYGCTAFLGGIAANSNTNFWSSNNNVYVVEADEYDRSFLKLKPDVAVISAMDADHLEIYGDEKGMQQGFIDFTAKIKPGGLLVSKYGLQRSDDLKASSHITYSVNNLQANSYATNITIESGLYCFDVIGPDWRIDSVSLTMGGLHNVENAVAAIIVAHHLQIKNDLIQKAILNFKGVKRRFEYIIPFNPVGVKNSSRLNNPVFIDDYAHHPQELKALISGAKSLFETKRCTIIFQPHLFSRTRDLAVEFASALDMADEIILLPIYPARENPMEGVTSELILNHMKNKSKHIFTKEKLLEWIKDKKDIELLITAGAGDIDQLVLPIHNLIQ